MATLRSIPLADQKRLSELYEQLLEPSRARFKRVTAGLKMPIHMAVEVEGVANPAAGYAQDP
jgi:hypothetical protein